MGQEEFTFECAKKGTESNTVRFIYTALRNALDARLKKLPRRRAKMDGHRDRSWNKDDAVNLAQLKNIELMEGVERE